MATRQKKNRIFWRKQSSSGETRAYADFRDFEDVGGKQEALIPPGMGRATSDPLIAEMLVAQRLTELQALRRDRIVLGSHKRVTLADFVDHHVTEKLQAASVTESWVFESRKKLDAAIDFFGSERDVATLTVADVQQWVMWLRQKKGRYGKASLSGGTVRHYLNCLSNLYRRAAAEAYVSPGFNPVAAMMEKPKANRHEAAWLEVSSAAELLRAAATSHRKRPKRALPHFYPLLATFLLTGGREMEVLGLEVDDISFSRKTVTFRPNQWRRLKTRTSYRSIPLWPQLESILSEYLNSTATPSGRLLFPSTRPSIEQPITDVRKAIDAAAEASGRAPGTIRTKAFRHTYCAARLQTLDRGHPVSLWTVAKELGHGGTALVERVYGHLGSIRQRSDVVEFR